MILQRVTSNEWISTSNQQRVKSYASDPYEGKYKLLINKRESTGFKVFKYLNDSKAFIEYSNGMGDIYKNIEE